MKAHLTLAVLLGAGQVMRGESEEVRSARPIRRIKIHLVALGLSLVLWPVALLLGRRRR